MPDDSYVKCDECSETKTVNFAHCLRDGWPVCCGHTMRLLRTEADIDAAVGKAVKGASFEVKGFFNG